MKPFFKLIVSLFVIIFFFWPCSAGAADIYLVYTSEDKTIQQELLNTLPSELDIKSYNASLLVIADYSGKQKASSKLRQAKLIVFISQKARELFSNSQFDNAIIIENNEQGNINEILTKLKE